MSKLAAIVQKLSWSLRRRGLVATVTMGLGRLWHGSGPRALARRQTHPFDAKHGVDTGGLVDGADLLTGHRHDAYSTAYWGVAPSRAREVLRRWLETVPPQRTVEDYTFIDVGCGKGRMLLIASELPFRRVLGVELNGALAAIARQNVEIWARANRGAAPITVLAQDATETAFPAGPCVFFLYNPFGPTVLNTLLTRLQQQALQRTNELDVIYLMAEFDDVFLEHKSYSLLWRGHIPQSSSDAEQDEHEDIIAGGAQPCSAYRLVRGSAA